MKQWFTPFLQGEIVLGLVRSEGEIFNRCQDLFPGRYGYKGLTLWSLNI